jgi:outer membrane protein OmpA-like peptidoglycan-associated protein/tetratricopeptide (TPR) repeat protein
MNNLRNGDVALNSILLFLPETNLFMRKVLLALVLLIFSSSSYAQNEKYTTKSAKAIKHFDRALNHYGGRSYNQAEGELQSALIEDPNFLEAHVLLAGVYSDMNKPEPAIEEYKKAIALRPDSFINSYFSVGKLEIDVARYSDAKAHLEQFIARAKPTSTLVKKAKRHIEICDFAMEALKSPVPFKPINLGEKVNTKHAEYLPTLTADEQTLIYTQRKPKDPGVSRMEEEDFYISRKINGEWEQAINLGPPINTPGNEGAQCISPDGKFLFYTACNRPNGLGSCDIFMAERIGNAWSEPVNLGAPVNSRSWESQPSISSDGRTLYFLSSRSGGFGKTDIWKTVHQDDGSWSAPENLGSGINTSDNEASPFIHPDNNTLYFASDGHIGMGGADLYYVRRKADGQWDIPKNLGYPINTSSDEGSLIVSATGNVAYFASDREEGKGALDLYSFELYREAQPQVVYYMKGRVFDSQSKKPVDAKFELIDLENAKVVVESSSDKINGEFLVCLPAGKDYALNVSKPGYLFYSDNFSLKDTSQIRKMVLMDVPMNAIRVGQSVVLKNIFFPSNDFSLQEASNAELEKLKNFLLSNKDVNIEFGGHTDNTGDKKYNQTLSEKRAKAVYDQLVKEGIPAARLSYKGYGDSKPVAPNDTPEGKARNRRTEFTITKQ